MQQSWLTAEWLTARLKASPRTSRCLGGRVVRRLSLAPLPNRGGRTGALLLRAEVVYSESPRPAAAPGGGAEAYDPGRQPATPPPGSFVIKVAEHRGRGGWAQTQDLNEVAYYRAAVAAEAAAHNSVSEPEGRPRDDHRPLPLPCVYCAEVDEVSGEGGQLRTVVVMDDLSERYHSGEALCGALRAVPDGCSKAAILCCGLVARLARFHHGAGQGGCRAAVAAAAEAGGRSAVAEFLLSGCFKVGAGHDRHKAALSAGSAHVEALLRRRRATGSMLAVIWPPGQPAAACDRQAFAVALGQATPALGKSEVLATLRAVAKGRQSCRAWMAEQAARDPEAAAAPLHGDFHPGNIMFDKSQIETWLASGEQQTQPPWTARFGRPPVFVDFQHCGAGPPAAELLYFFVHAKTMWALPTSALPAVLAAYVTANSEAKAEAGSTAVGTCSPSSSCSQQQEQQEQEQQEQQQQQQQLAEQMLAILVEWVAAFLVDDTHDERRNVETARGSDHPRMRPPSGVTPQSYTIRLPKETVADGAAATAAPPPRPEPSSKSTTRSPTNTGGGGGGGVVQLLPAKVNFEFSTAAPGWLASAASGCLRWAWQQNAMLQLASDLLHDRKLLGADSQLGMQLWLESSAAHTEV
eukprot:SAG22_NODE_1422_length_4464_cov_3.424742_3_plen_636_part_00